MGRSLGTGPTCELGSKRPVKGVILQSPLMSAVRVVVNSKVTLPIDIFANLDKIRKVKAPVFIIHGMKDEVIDVSHGQTLFKLTEGTPSEYAPWWIPNAGHNDIEYKFEAVYLSKLAEFLQYLDKTPKVEEQTKSKKNCKRNSTSSTSLFSASSTPEDTKTAETTTTETTQQTDTSKESSSTSKETKAEE